MVSQLLTKFLVPVLLIVASFITIVALFLSWHSIRTALIEVPEYTFQTATRSQEPEVPQEYDYNGDALSDPEVVGEYGSSEPFVPVEPKSCYLPTTKTRMVLFVSSRPNDAEMRLSIRSSWGAAAKTCGMFIVFGFGTVDSNSLQDEITKEGRVFGDILQVEHVQDSYRNQTRIVLGFYEWARLNCNQTEFIAKADDDTWINLPVVLSRLESIKAKSFVAGYWFPPGTLVMRSPEHAQCLSREEKPDDYYPAYCSGILYVIPTRMVTLILDAAATMPSYWIDDAFITGDVITKINKEFARSRKRKTRELVVRYDLTGWLTLPYNQSTTRLCRLLLKSTIMHRIDSYTKQALDNLSCLQELRSCTN